jgi:hypothetical protein
MNKQKGKMKRVVWLEKTDSALFESACFVLRADIEQLPVQTDMLAEAERIVASHAEELAKRRYGTRKKPRFALGFFLGIAVAAVLAALIFAFALIFT